MTTLEVTNKYAPVEPDIHYGPQRIAPETYLIRQLQEVAGAPVSVYMNSMVILGEQPVIVDTGTEANRRQWFKDLESLVDPRDVRWIFISHDDHDHTGNLVEVLEACPNATFISSWFQVERLSCSINFPLERMRFLNDGESFDAGDRVLSAIRPPVYDAPTTRGLYDPKTKVYWAVDTFAGPVMQPVEDMREVETEFWRDGFNTFHSLISPWHAVTDAAKFGRSVDRIANLDIEVAVGAHTAPVRGSRLQESFELLRALPNAVPSVMPGQDALEAMLAEMSA